MLKVIRADLHIHTCLSPCGDLKMSPQNIIKKALQENLDVIAISDHNSAENARAVMAASTGQKPVVFPGMEICTAEEVHVIAFFENLESASELQRIVYENLSGENNPNVFGMQVVANESDEVVEFNNRLLIGATDLSVERVANEIHRLNGLAIASHIDRESFSIIGQLGFIPDSVKFDALEISVRMDIAGARKQFPEYGSYPIIRNSDAHFLDDIGRAATKLLVGSISFDEIRKAFHNEDGRKILE